MISKMSAVCQACKNGLTKRNCCSITKTANTSSPKDCNPRAAFCSSASPVAVNPCPPNLSLPAGNSRFTDSILPPSKAATSASPNNSSKMPSQPPKMSRHASSGSTKSKKDSPARAATMAAYPHAWSDSSSSGSRNAKKWSSSSPPQTMSHNSPPNSSDAVDSTNSSSSTCQTPMNDAKFYVSI